MTKRTTVSLIISVLAGVSLTQLTAAQGGANAGQAGGGDGTTTVPATRPGRAGTRPGQSGALGPVRPFIIDPAKTPRTAKEVIAAAERMSDAQIAVWSQNNSYPATWIEATFYAALARLSHVSDHPQKYIDVETAIANKHAWIFQEEINPNTRVVNNIAFADNDCIGQMYIDLAATINDLGKLAGMRKQMDEIVATFDNPTPENQARWNNRIQRDQLAMPWWWCDALFMAPAMFTRLSAVTGDPKYIDAADKQWWVSSGHLYSKDDHLFFRDASFFNRTTPNGKKVFWARGNGWVVGGLANVLTYMPKDYPSRPKYEQQFKDMMEKLAGLQQSDGTWRASLIDPDASPYPETSGTAFFCYGMAWGINHGLLNRTTYEPMMDKSWAALNAAIRPDGLLGWVQRVGGGPAPSDADTTQPYGVGAYVLASVEIAALRNGK